MSKRRQSEEEIRRQAFRGERRRGYYGGVYGVSYIPQSYYLNPDQFGYTTAQADGLGDASSGGGDAGAGGGSSA